jgi:hypothetical protein
VTIGLLSDKISVGSNVDGARGECRAISVPDHRAAVCEVLGKKSEKFRRQIEKSRVRAAEFGSWLPGRGIKGVLALFGLYPPVSLLVAKTRHLH